MDYTDIQKGLSKFVERYDSQTYLGSYRDTSRNSLLNDGLSTRANSLWKMAEYVVAKYDNNTKAKLSEYLNGWKVLASNMGNQFLLLEESPSSWGMYDAKGKRLGGEDFISDYFERMKKHDPKSKNVDGFDVKLSMIPYWPYITAIKSKPFLLLAGISGTGKSRIVREFAFKSCPKYLQDKDGTTPGNYCMIEVKPNWHDSTELLGYYSRLGQGGYQFTKFVKFLVKAKMFPDVPFFVCLDEMNLAPVEQYFAEILSILETRKHPKSDPNSIKTEVIIEARYFKDLEEVKLNYSKGSDTLNKPMTDRQIYMELFGIKAGEEDDIVEETNKYDLTTEGLTLPDNILIIGTVNMDDTTHQFSRKVIDRAMTIEMNGGKLANMYGGSKDLEYLDEEEQQKWQQAFKQHYVTADEVLEKHLEMAKDITEKLPQRLDEINQALKDTPFEVSYRVLNELTIMVGVMLDEKGEEANIDDVINQAVDNILLMKILPRIEGDSEMFAIKGSNKTRLDLLKEIAPTIEPAEKGTYRQTAKDKIQEMIDRLNNQEFTRFWP